MNYDIARKHTTEKNVDLLEKEFGNTKPAIITVIRFLESLKVEIIYTWGNPDLVKTLKRWQ